MREGTWEDLELGQVGSDGTSAITEELWTAPKLISASLGTRMLFAESWFSALGAQWNYLESLGKHLGLVLRINQI